MLSKRDPLKMSVPAIKDEFYAVLNGCMNTNPPYDENAFILAPYIKRMEELLFGVCQKLSSSKFKPTDIRFIDLDALATRMGDAVAAQRARRDELPTVKAFLQAERKTLPKPFKAPIGRHFYSDAEGNGYCFHCGLTQAHPKGLHITNAVTPGAAWKQVDAEYVVTALDEMCEAEVARIPAKQMPTVVPVTIPVGDMTKEDCLRGVPFYERVAPQSTPFEYSYLQESHQQRYDRLTRIGRYIHEFGPKYDRARMSAYRLIDTAQTIIRLESRMSGREIR